MTPGRWQCAIVKFTSTRQYRDSRGQKVPYRAVDVRERDEGTKLATGRDTLLYEVYINKTSCLQCVNLTWNLSSSRYALDKREVPRQT